MNDIDYKKKYNDMSYWVAKVIGQTNELYKTLSEQIVMLIEENDQLRKALESKKDMKNDEIKKGIEEIEGNEIKKKNIKIDTTKINNLLNEDQESDEIEEIIEEMESDVKKMESRTKEEDRKDVKEEKPNEEKQNE